jgi:hypothetical protein
MKTVCIRREYVLARKRTSKLGQAWEFNKQALTV